MEKIYYIKDLGCPNCAAKMEVAVGKIKGVKSSNVSFMNKKLIVDIESADMEEAIVAEALKKMRTIESEVDLIPYEEYKAGEEEFHQEEEDHDHDHHHHHEEGCGCGDHDHHHHEKGCGCKDHDYHHHEEEHAHKEKEHSHEDHDHGDVSKASFYALIVGIVIFIANVVLSKIGVFNDTISMIVYIISYLLIAYDILIKSLKNISKGQVFDEFFLMSVATIGAIIIGEYPEAVGVMLFYKLGEYFQDKAVDSARHSIKALVNIKPEYANLVTGSSTKKVSPNSIKVGDVIEVKPGERIPLDGDIIEGSTSLDVSAITGEAKPQDAFTGDFVYSGSINKTGLIKIKVTKKFADSTVSRIMEMVENASDKKSHTEQFITRFARIYTPIVVFLALAIAILPPIISGSYDFYGWVYKALSFLVVSCPCALVISVPLGFFGGIGVASKNGILIKGGNYLETLADINVVAFDKTGTLTYGSFEVTDIRKAEGVSEEDILKYAAFGECKTNHPIAHAILDKNKTPINKEDIKEYKEISGYGVEATLEEGAILVGNQKLMEKYNIDFTPADTASTVVYVAFNNKYLGVILIADKIKETSREGIEALNVARITKTVVLSGDNQAIVDEVGDELGIEYKFGQLLPENKLEKVESIYEDNEDVKLAFVGDGINDAPVLARADIGIAMGGAGQDAAIEAADVVIMTDDISKLAKAVAIGRYTRQIVMENIILALTIKVFVLVLVTIGISNMWMAVFADVGVALLAVLNSIRVYKHRF